MQKEKNEERAKTTKREVTCLFALISGDTAELIGQKRLQGRIVDCSKLFQSELCNEICISLFQVLTRNIGIFRSKQPLCCVCV